MKDELCFEVTNTTYFDYMQFCKLMNVNHSDRRNKVTFFDYILHNKLIKDTKLNTIVLKGD